MLSRQADIKQTNANSGCEHQPQIMEVFMITKLDKLFRIGTTQEEALKSFE